MRDKKQLPQLVLLVCCWFVLSVGVVRTHTTTFDLNGNATNESSATSTIGGWPKQTLTHTVNNGLNNAAFDFDWTWGGLQFKGRVAASGTRTHSHQTYKSTVLENGNISFTENPPTLGYGQQAFPADAWLPVFSALLHMGLGDLLSVVSSDSGSEVELTSAITPSGDHYYIQNSITNNWTNPLTVDWSAAGLSGTVNPGETLQGDSIFAWSVDEGGGAVTVDGLYTSGDGVNFTHIGPTSFWVATPEPSSFLLMLMGSTGVLGSVVLRIRNRVGKVGKSHA